MKVPIQGQTLLILLLITLALVTIISVPALARPSRLLRARQASQVNMTSVTAPARRDLHPKEAEVLLKGFEVGTRVLESHLEDRLIKVSMITIGSPSPPFFDALYYNLAHEKLALQVYSMLGKGPEHGYSSHVEGGSRGSGNRELPRPY